MEKMVYALFDREDDANRAVETLLGEGLGAELISVLLHRDDITQEDLTGRGTKTRERALLGGVLAGSIGAALGGLLLGPLGLVGAGPLAGFLFGVGGAYGAVGGAITGADDSQDKLDNLRQALADGKILVTVETTNIEKAEEIEERLKKFGGRRSDILR